MNQMNIDKIENKKIDNEAIHFYWKNLSYKTVKNKILVNNLSGHLQSGYLTAILGPSGSGKTTLFECLAKRRIKGMTGQTWVSSSISDFKEVRIIYNPQKDFLFSVLSIRENLNYACQLQRYCGRNIDILNDNTMHGDVKLLDASKYDYHKVEEIIDQLGLTQCADVRVRNCSGGQKKRLSIALELIFSPNVLLLDEPTTGLDSVSSLQLVQLLKTMVKNNPIIICATIHQPSAKLFSYFDDLYVISTFGTCIYRGPGSQVLDHFQSFGLNCPVFHNISDFVLEIASGLHGDEIIYKLTDAEASKELIDQNKYRVNVNVDRALSKEMAFDQIQSSWALFKRSSLISYREPFNYALRSFGLLMLMAVRLILKNRQTTLIDNECFNSTRFAKKFIEMGSNPENYKITAFLSRDIILLITSVMFTVIISLVPSLMLFPLELSVFIKEHSNKWYTRWSYYIAKSCSDIPATLLFPLIYAVFTWFLVESPPGIWRFFVYIALIVSTSLLSHSFAMVISIHFINNTIASLICGAMLFVPFFIFSGFVIPVNKLPYYVRPFTYLSVYKLSIEAVLIIFYGFGRCNPDHTALKLSDFTAYFGPSIMNITSCMEELTSLPPVQYIIDGFNSEIKTINQSIILSRFDLNNIDLFINFGFIIGYTIILRVLAYIILMSKSIAK
ncbi:ATP-binding cassette sub-family G member 1-like [Dermatophagoides pteronyssinus]|uniref:ATP-binding cassette sub-family G member 1-like n=1 Tax=Dermatophagoides pteronyssinus TaxID=6956 RepID=UPI003F667F64